jgi:hypothetical protein
VYKSVSVAFCVYMGSFDIFLSLNQVHDNLLLIIALLTSIYFSDFNHVHTHKYHFHIFITAAVCVEQVDTNLCLPSTPTPQPPPWTTWRRAARG